MARITTVTSTSDDFNIKRRLILVISSFICCLGTAGVIFGFSSLQPVLEHAGIYAHLCPAGQTKCPAQSDRLMLMFTLASSATNLVSLPIGYTLDRFGPKKSMICGSLTFTLACVLFILSFVFTVDIYIPAFVLFAIGGPFIFLSTLHLSCAIPAYSNLIMAALTCAFDISSAVFLIFNKLYFGTGGRFGIKEFFSVYLLIPVFAFFVAATLMPSQSFTLPSSPQNGEGDSLLIAEKAESAAITRNDDEEQEEGLENIGDELDDPEALTDHTRPGSLAEASIKEQFKSWEFILLLVFMSLYVLRFNFFIGSLVSYLSTITDAIAEPLLVFGIALPIGPLLAILFTTALLNRSFAVSYWTLTVMNVAFSILNLIPMIETQYGGFALFVLMRSMLYTFANQFCAKVFGFKNFGTVYGTLMLIGGAFNLFQYLFSHLTLSVWHGAYFNSFLILSLLTCTLGTLFPLYLTIKRL